MEKEAALRILHDDVLINVVHFLDVEGIVDGVLLACRTWKAISACRATWSYLHFGVRRRGRPWDPRDVVVFVRRAQNLLCEISLHLFPRTCLTYEETWKEIVSQGDQPMLRSVTLVRPVTVEGRAVATMAIRGSDLAPLLPLHNSSLWASCASCETKTRLRTLLLTSRDNDGKTITTLSAVPGPCYWCDYDWSFVCSQQCARDFFMCSMCKYVTCSVCFDPLKHHGLRVLVSTHLLPAGA